MTDLADTHGRSDLRERTRRRRRRARLVLTLLLLALVALMIGASLSGPVSISLRSLVEHLTSTAETGEIRFFEEHGVDVTEARAIRPSLEDVFVRITGVALEQMRKEKELGKGKGDGA